ncbi:hypothetical protein ACSAZL_18020 [Methanosarcina sp. T3]|uniref:hypothetical protein n=1 Tax=Methanosarcina sp. T3 TaxID=3439062 RepID=UPI003F877A7A
MRGSPSLRMKIVFPGYTSFVNDVPGFSGCKLPCGNDDVEASLWHTQFRLQPVVSSHAISPGGFVMAIIN